MFTVAIKESATRLVPRLAERVAEEGSTLSFRSRDAAAAFVADLDPETGAVRLQAPAPQDPADVDAYLVRDGQANEWEPIDADGRGATFPVGANTYGAIGVGILVGDGSVSPPLRHYFAESAPQSRRGTVTDVRREPSLPAALSAAVSWRPDLRIAVETGRSGPPDVHFAEVKAGNASFERGQRAAMRRVAEDAGVLRIRIDLADLPSRYTVRIDEVTATAWPD